MYTIEQVVKGIKNPRYIKNEIKNKKRTWDDLKWDLHSTVTRKVFTRNDPPIPKKDWDNLLLLDACRYDLFKECNILPGNLQPYYSVASNTKEYVERTFQDKEFPEIVCITSTPKYYKLNVEDSFHDIIHVWRDDWDEESRTVLPEDMNNRVLQAVDKYPNKRILAHYIPPHKPYIGKTGREMPHQIQFCGDVIQQDMDEPHTWDAIKDGTYKKERVWRAYKENLELTLPAIENILSQLHGKTVVTSDHGNVFGDLREYRLVGHPRDRHIKPLIKVPWLTYRNGERKTIKQDEIKAKKTAANEEMVESRLSDLGYVE